MKIIVCGEIKTARKCECLLKNIAKHHNEFIEVILATSGKQLLFYMNAQYTDVDLVYIEYDLVDSNGIEIAKEIRKQEIPIDIVMWADDKVHISEGYDVDALYYLEKAEIHKEKFREVFIKALKRAKMRNRRYLSLVCAGETRNIELDSIQFFEVNKRIVSVHYDNCESFAFYSTLSRLEQILCDNGFVRIHQAYLVSKKYIKRINRNNVVLTDDTMLPIGRSYQGKMRPIMKPGISESYE